MFTSSRLTLSLSGPAVAGSPARDRKDDRLKRSVLATLSLLSLPLLAATALPASAASHASSTARFAGNSATSINEPICQSVKSTCADVGLSNGNKYVGHDEP